MKWIKSERIQRLLRRSQNQKTAVEKQNKLTRICVIPEIPALDDAIYQVGKKLGWLDNWMQENLSEKQRQKLEHDYELWLMMG